MDTPCPPPRSVSIEHLRTPSPTPNTAEGCVDDIDPTLAPNPYINLSPLNFKDVRQDPILAALAKAQSTHPPPQPTSTTPKAPPKTSTTMFSARPAPASMKTEGLGPRMTKSAALRQGLTWEEKPRRPTTADGGGKVEFGNVPGHKRANMSISIASLAAPTVMPRQTKASQLRTGQAVTSSAVKRDPIAVAAANRETAAAEKVKRRASIAIPASLSAPQIAPRGNRSSELRTGVPSGTNTTRAVHSRTHSVLGTTSANNVENNIAAHDAVKAEEKAKPRASVMGTLKSLGAPSIVPRMNKSSNLRTAPAGTPGAMSPPQLPVSQSSRSIATVSNAGRPAASVKPTASSTRPLSYAGPSPNTEPSDVYPKPTRSSMLRAGLGAKVQTK